MKNLWKKIFFLILVESVFVFSGCYTENYEVWEVLNNHEKRIKKIEETLKDYDILRDSIEELESYKGKVEDLEIVVNQLKEDQKSLKNNIDNVSVLSETEMKKLNEDITNLNKQIQEINEFVNKIDVSVRPMLFKNQENKTMVAFIISNGMVIYVSGNGSTLSSEFYVDVSMYTYFISGIRCLSFDGIEVNNFPSDNEFFRPKLEDYFGLEVCNYIADSYSELIKNKGYKIVYAFENPENSVKYFYCRPIN